MLKRARCEFQCDSEERFAEELLGSNVQPRYTRTPDAITPDIELKRF